jgi:hypothetical protein
LDNFDYHSQIDKIRKRVGWGLHAIAGKQWGEKGEEKGEEKCPL